MNKAARLAWVFCGLIVLLSLFNLVKTLPGSSSIENQGDLGSVVLVGFLIPVVFAVLAALILSRQPNNVIGWLLMMPALAGVIPAEVYIRSFSSAPAHPPLLLLLAIWYSGWSWLLLIFPVFFIPVLFPTGKPPSPRWRWLLIAGLSMCGLLIFLATFTKIYDTSSFNMDWTLVNPIGFLPPDFFDRYFAVPWVVGLISMTLLSVASLFVRYRSAPSMERQQIKWLLYACALFAVFYIPADWISVLGPGISALWNLFSIALILAIPAAIAIAILRFRLWDIDVIIRRTLQYSLVTGLLALIYFGSVLLGQRVAGALTGEPDSTLVLVVSTLLVAALFNPLRTRAQDFIDRRFYRRKYDALQTLAAFTQAARDETRLEALVPALLQAVQDSVEPEQAWLWLKKGGK